MELLDERLSSDRNSTLGAFFINERFACFLCEDEHRDVKVPGETRIPPGRYPVTLYAAGRLHDKYLARYGAEFHKGMLLLNGVPGFTGVEIHAGVTEADTDGCLLPGTVGMLHETGGGNVGNSRQAYEKIYPTIRDALLRGEPVNLTVTDRDR